MNVQKSQQTQKIKRGKYHSVGLHHEYESPFLCPKRKKNISCTH